MLARSVGARVLDEGPGVVFAGVAPVLKAADIAVVNLECAIAASGEPEAKGYTFRAPPVAASALSLAGVDIVSLANNHSLDYGPEALAETLKLLAARGVAAAGAGPDAGAARAAVILEHNGLRIAFLAAADVPAEGSFSRSTWEAATGKPGLAWLDTELLVADIVAARAHADVVVVMLHFGVEFSDGPGARQREQARTAIDAGATLIIGHHPHVLHEVEEYRGGLIAYSLGNFVFDGFDPPSNTSAILEVEFVPGGIRSHRLIPVEVIDGLPVLSEE